MKTGMDSVILTVRRWNHAAAQVLQSTICNRIRFGAYHLLLLPNGTDHVYHGSNHPLVGNSAVQALNIIGG